MRGHDCYNSIDCRDSSVGREGCRFCLNLFGRRRICIRFCHRLRCLLVVVSKRKQFIEDQILWRFARRNIPADISMNLLQYAIFQGLVWELFLKLLLSLSFVSSLVLHGKKHGYFLYIIEDRCSVSFCNWTTFFDSSSIYSISIHIS